MVPNPFLRLKLSLFTSSSAVMKSDGYIYFLNALFRLYSKTDTHNLS